VVAVFIVMFVFGCVSQTKLVHNEPFASKNANGRGAIRSDTPKIASLSEVSRFRAAHLSKKKKGPLVVPGFFSGMK